MDRKALLLTIDFPPQTGGVATYLANFAANLPPEQITVLAQSAKNAFLFDQTQKYKIFRAKLSYSFFWPRWTKAYWAAYKVIMREKINLLIISHVLPMGYLALIFKKRLQLPYVVICHGLDVRLSQSTDWKRYWLKKILKNAYKIIVNSNYTRSLILEEGITADKIEIVAPCPSLQQIIINEDKLAELKQQYDLENKKVILSVGRLVERKGFDYTLLALKSLKTSLTDFKYIIIGQGPYEKKLKKIIEQEKLSDSVIILNNINNELLPYFYQLADVFIMPSRIINEMDVEGFGLVYLEANLYKKPVIAGNSGGVTDAVINNFNGLLVDPENINEISQAILDLINNPEAAKQMGENGYNRIINEFTWPKQIEKIKQLLFEELHN